MLKGILLGWGAIKAAGELFRAVKRKRQEARQKETTENGNMGKIASYVLPSSLSWWGGAAIALVGLFLMVKGDTTTGVKLFLEGLAIIGIRGKLERG